MCKIEDKNIKDLKKVRLKTFHRIEISLLEIKYSQEKNTKKILITDDQI